MKATRRTRYLLGDSKEGDGSNEFYSHHFEKDAVGFPVLKNVFIEQVGQKRDGRNYRGMSFDLKAIDAASLSVDAFFAEAGTKAKGFLRRTFKFRLDSVSDTCTRQTMRDDCEKIRTIVFPDLNEAVGIPLSGAFDRVV